MAKRHTALALVLAVMLLAGCAPEVRFDDVHQAYLLPALVSGKQQVAVVTAEGEQRGTIDAVMAYPLTVYDPWEYFFAYTDTNIWEDEEQHWWMAVTGDGYVPVSPGGNVMGGVAYADIWKLDGNIFVGALDESRLNFFDSSGVVFATVVSSGTIDYSMADGMVRLSLETSASLTVNGRTTRLPDGVSFVNPQGEAIAVGLSDAVLYSDGLCAVYKDQMWGFMDKQGTMVIKPRFTEVVSFYDGLCAVSEGEGMFFIDKSGENVSRETYDEAAVMPGGYLAVREGEKWRYLDRSFAQIGGEYDMIQPFAKGYGIAYNADAEGYPTECFVIAPDGTEHTFPDNVTVYECFGSDRFVAYDSNSGRMGVCGLDGVFLLEPVYDDIISAPDGSGAMTVVYDALAGELVGYIDGDLKTVLAPEYTSIDYCGQVITARSSAKSCLFALDGTLLYEADLPAYS